MVIQKNLFKKGHKQSPKNRKKISNALKGKTAWNKGLKGYNSGHIVSKETKKKISEKLKGNKNSLGFKHSPERNKLISEAQKKIVNRIGHWTGKKRPEMSGPNNYNWKGGITPTNHRIRTSLEFKEWRRKVFRRDDYTCQGCGVRGIELHPHHIYSFAEYPEYRFETWNGQTLCVLCHMNLHKELRRG